MHRLGSFICAVAAIVSTATAQSATAHECYSKPMPDIDSHEVSPGASLADIVATAGLSFTRQSGCQASISNYGPPNKTIRTNLLSEMPVGVVSPTIQTLPNPSSSGSVISSDSANWMAKCAIAAPSCARNVTMDGSNTKTKNVHMPHSSKPAHTLVRYDSAAFAGAGALIGAALLF